MGTEVEWLMSIEDLKEVYIGYHAHKVTKIGASSSVVEERELVDQLIKNVYLFTWAPSIMLGIDSKMVRHHLAIHTSPKPVAQRKWKVGEEKKASINEEVGKLSDVGFITNMKYPT